MRWTELRTLLLTLVVLAISVPSVSGNAGELPPMPSAALDRLKPPRQLLFGSCYKLSRGGKEIWETIADLNPDLFLFAGDTVYPDGFDKQPELPLLSSAYRELAKDPYFASLRSSVPVLAVWDDHDYGDHDGGGDFPWRETSEAMFEQAWGLAADDPRRQRPGVYFSQVLGEGDETVQIIMLDTRFFRSPLQVSDARGSRGKERYIPTDDPRRTMLGDAQWAWLAEELQRPVALRLVVSSVQLLGDGHGWEGWHQMPRERSRLMALLREQDHSPTIVLSGDRHVAGFYEMDVGLHEPLLEFTSSALNNTIAFPYRRLTLGEEGIHRLGDLYGEANVGAVAIDWERRVVTLRLHGRDGAVIREEQRSLRAP